MVWIAVGWVPNHPSPSLLSERPCVCEGPFRGPQLGNGALREDNAGSGPATRSARAGRTRPYVKTRLWPPSRRSPRTGRTSSATNRNVSFDVAAPNGAVTPLTAKGECFMELSPGGIIAWIIVGLIAGWAASNVSRGHGYGLVGDLIVGLVGALLGGFLAGLFIHGSVGLFGTIIIAFLGALILLFILRMFGRGRVGA